MLSENFFWLGFAIGTIGTAVYIRAILRGQIQPNRLSWFILGIAPLIAFAAEVQAGVGIRSLMTFWSGFSPLLIFFASFVNKNATWKLTRFDKYCAATSVCALVLWQLSGSGNVAIALSILADGMAFLPIVVKAWRFPHTESPWTFMGGTCSSGIALLVLNRWTFADYAFPAYIFLACVAITAIILVRPRFIKVVDARDVLANEPRALTAMTN